MALTLPTPALPGATGGYIPTFLGGETTGLIVSYSRDPKKFLVNRLMTTTKVDKLTGYWRRANPEVLSRIYSDPDEAVWPDGAVAPSGVHNKQDWSLVPYSCVRRAESDWIGYQLQKQSVYPHRESMVHVLGHRMMLRRAINFYTKALSTDYYLSDHTATVAAIAGTSVTWANATGSNPYIFQSLMYAAEIISKKTVGAVQLNGPDGTLTLVLSPTAARKMAATEEIRNYLAQSPFALDQVRGAKPGQNSQWGLPDQLYGFKVEVDTTIQNTGQRLGTASNAFLASDTKAMILFQPGDMDQNALQFGSAFSTWHLMSFEGEEMATEEFDDPINKRLNIRVTDTWGVHVVAPETGFLLTSVF